MRIRTACVLSIGWFALGLLGGAARNAQYQLSPYWWQNNCYVEAQQWEHTSDELTEFLPFMGGPVYFLVSFARTGAFASGFSFRLGVPERCR